MDGIPDPFERNRCRARREGKVDIRYVVQERQNPGDSRPETSAAHKFGQDLVAIFAGVAHFTKASVERRIGSPKPIWWSMASCWQTCL